MLFLYIVLYLYSPHVSSECYCLHIDVIFHVGFLVNLHVECTHMSKWIWSDLSRVSSCWTLHLDTGMIHLECVHMVIKVQIDVHAILSFVLSMLSYVTALVCNAFAILPFYINRTRHLIERGIHVVPISQMRVNRNLAEGLRRARNYPDRSSTRVDGLYMSES